LFLFLFEECTHDNPTAIEWWSKIAWKKAKDQFIEYIHRPFTIQNELIDGLELGKHIQNISISIFSTYTFKCLNQRELLLEQLLSFHHNN